MIRFRYYINFTSISFFSVICEWFNKQQEYSDPRDADDARYSLDGRELDGARIIVEFARGVFY